MLPCVAIYVCDHWVFSRKKIIIIVVVVVVVVIIKLIELVTRL